MNGKKAKQLRRQSERLAVQTALAADQKGLELKFKDTTKRIQKDLKRGNL